MNPIEKLAFEWFKARSLRAGVTLANIEATWQIEGHVHVDLMTEAMAAAGVRLAQ